MRIAVGFAFVLLSLCTSGQYTYFNLNIPPENPESGGGMSINLITRNDTLGTYGVSYDGVLGFQRTHHFVDSSGSLFEIRNFEYPNDLFFYLEYSDTFVKINSGYISGGAFSDSTYPKVHGRVYKFDDALAQEWVYVEDDYQADTIYYSDYPVARELENGDIVAAGTVALDTNGTFDFGGEFENIIVTKLTASGEFMWKKELNFTNDLLFELSQPFVRISDLFELENGQLLLFGSWYTTYQPFALLLNSEGEFIDHVSWGNSTQNDWLPWAVQISPTQFMFAYQHATGIAQPGEDFVEHKPRVGVLNITTMEVSDFTIYDHYHVFGRVTDFERTPDGGFVILGYGGDEPIGGVSFEEAYMLKIDSDGNELWYQSYDPPVDHITSEVWDLEVTSDGGLAFVGNFEIPSPPYYHSWVVKTDACGDEVYNGCPVTVEEYSPMDVSFQISPNPSDHHFTLSSKREFDRISIRDLAGRIVFSSEMGNHVLTTQVYVSNLSSGLYLVEVDYGNGEIGAQKLVVE